MTSDDRAMLFHHIAEAQKAHKAGQKNLFADHLSNALLLAGKSTAPPVPADGEIDELVLDLKGLGNEFGICRKAVATITALQQCVADVALMELAADGQAHEALERAEKAEARVKELEQDVAGLDQASGKLISIAYQQVERADKRIEKAEALATELAALLNDKQYVQLKADYNKGHLSHHNWLQEKEAKARAAGLLK